MDNANGHTMNLANSIIGVSILAMPYCFKQCGVLLSVLILLISSIISRLACHFLLKSAIKARRKTFEFLAFHVFGTLGKFSIEIGMIGFQLGTCVAFFVVMGDLGPAIISEMTGVVIGSALRNSTLIALAVFCVLPLGLLRNVDSLNGVSKATIGFYCCLVLKIVVEAFPHIFMGDWVGEVEIWRPAGILQCLPIFSMALFCQTQLFEIYQAIPNASLDKMNSMIRVAVNICTWVYIFVGTFGYIAFFQKPFTGNILLSFRPSVTSDVIKIGFVLSLAFSFPLVIFPCRASLFSLLYKGPSYTSLHEGGTSNYIPEVKFKMLTLIIVAVSCVIALIIPNIELVLGLVGSTIGVMICVLFPVTCFICISPKNTNERILAQIMLFVGIIVMVLGTYANLYAFEEATLSIVTEKVQPPPPPQPEISIPEKPVVMEIPTTVKAVIEEKKQKPPPEPVKLKEVKKEESPKEVRHEPPQPEEPAENKTPKDIGNEDKAVQPVVLEDKEKQQSVVEDKKEKQNPVVEPVQPVEDTEDKKEGQKPVVEPVQPVEDVEAKEKQKPVVEPVQPVEDLETKKAVEHPKEEVKKEQKKTEEIDIEAIKKEETELKEQEKKDNKEKDSNQILIDTIQKQNEVQKEMVKQQQKLIEVIQQQQEIVKNKDIDKVKEEKVKAVKQIESIAKKAIESISGQDAKLVPKEENPIETIAKKAIETINNQKEETKANKTKTVQVQEKKNDTIKMLPLPIALAMANNATLETKTAENKTQPKEDSDVKNIRRDILSETIEVRAKREVSVDKIENLNKAVKEVCDEMNRLTSTEKPIINMLCKLSEPGLVKVPELGMDGAQHRDVKPQKRDLKQFSENNL